MKPLLIIFILFAVITCKQQKPDIDLHTAVVTDNQEIIKQHIKTGSDLNIVEPSRQSTPLITAAASGRTEAAKLLMAAGADLNYQNADGSTALHTAAVFGNEQIAQLLITAGCRPDLKNNDGATALHVAAFLGRTEIVKALLAGGADVSVKNKRGNTALQTVQTPFDDMLPVYDAISAGLKPLGVTLDYQQIRTARPQIATLLE